MRQSAGEVVDEPTTIGIFGGARGPFRWYEDDGVSEDSLQGKFAWTSIIWDDKARQLTIEPSRNRVI